MKKFKSLLSFVLSLTFLITPFTSLSIINTSAAVYEKIPALQISRVYCPQDSSDSSSYLSSVITLQGYSLGSYYYNGKSTDYRVPGQDYSCQNSSDALSEYFNTILADTPDRELSAHYPISVTCDTEGIGKNTDTYEKIYAQLSQGKPVMISSNSHSSLVIGYNGSSAKLEASGFTVLETSKTADNTYWGNNATYYNTYANAPQSISSLDGCYVSLDSWIDYHSGNLTEICYPTDTVHNSSKFSFDADGGTGVIMPATITYGKSMLIPNTNISKKGYSFEGFNVYRVCDEKWYCTTAGWQTAQSILDNNFQKFIYNCGDQIHFNYEWLRNGGTMGTEYIFCPIWAPLTVSLDFYGNYSGTNYMISIDKNTFSDYYQSNDDSVYTLSTAEEETSSTALVIEGSSAGAVGKDLLFKTQTNQSSAYNYGAGDDKSLILTFKARSSADNSNMILRWGYTSDTTSVTLSEQWKEYAVDMSKQPTDGANIYAYFDQSGTFYIKDIVLKDTKADEPFENETSDLIFSMDFTVGDIYGDLPTPIREGYSFKGWYTSKHGGIKITKNTYVLNRNTAVYARWDDAHNVDTVLMGDADMSGIINVKDATYIQKGLAGITALSPREAFCANVQNSDDLNIRDATAIQKWCAGIYTPNIFINVITAYKK